MKKKVILSFLALSLISGLLLSSNTKAWAHSAHHAHYRPHHQAPVHYRGHRMPPPPPVRRHHIYSNYYYSPNVIFRYNSGYYPIPRGYYDPFMYPNYGFSFGISI